ncbi:outer membrane beta-barrel protein [uncultured Psychroserpens sp.]|uniref:outer membrane beta-barrel protein n=1 Tax=uncultured Psychroserpens sp. TaxID=255436 RepID=UPI002631CA8A|nr:outer membrane beta-barrel protein [uncultured Psychroserpens sp.]
MRFLITGFFIVLYLQGFAQPKHIIISGKIVSEIDGNPLESATAFIQNVKDSSVIGYTITDKKGIFTIKELVNQSKIDFFVSFVGHQTFHKSINTNTSPIQLGSIVLKPSELNAVIVKSTAPVTVKKDTLEFNASSFKTKKNATVEDLLKKLPGVEVFDDGSIKVNGKEVNKILINGKSFFSDDPTIATRSLSKDIIDKVQVTNTKSKQEAFANEKGSKTKSTLNFTIKKNLGKGVFGRISGGSGSSKRYEFAGIVNHFSDDSQLSALGSGNNINSPGFSFGEIQKMFGKGDNNSRGNNDSFKIDGRQFGGDRGIVTSSNAGINYTNDIGKSIEYSGNYFYADANTNFEQISFRENIMPDFNYFSNSEYKSKSNIKNHTTKLNTEIVIDSTFLITLKSSIGYSDGYETINQNQESKDIENTLINETISESNLASSNRNFENLFTLTKRIGNKGSFFKLKMSQKFNNTNFDEQFKSRRTIFEQNTTSQTRDLFLYSNRKKKYLKIGAAYRIPINGYTLFIDLKQNFEAQNQGLNQNVFDFDTQSQDYTIFNEDISAQVSYKKSKYYPEFNISYQKEKWSATLGINYALFKLNNTDNLRSNFAINNDFKSFEYNSFLTYNPKPGSFFNLSYSLKNNVPNFGALQSFQDISDPLNTIVGNSNLKFSKNHQVFGIYNSFNFEKRKRSSSHFKCKFY